MNAKHRSEAWCAAVVALALTACPPPAGDTRDGNEVGPTDGSVSQTDGGTAKGDGGLACTQAQRDQNCLSRVCGSDGCGGFCGTAGGACPDGKDCDPSGRCVAKTCASTVGACGKDQYCDTSGPDPVCVEICGQSGCRPGEICVHNADGKTGQCQPPSCPEGSGTVCKQGQVCGWWGEMKPCSADADCSGPDTCQALPDGKFCSHPECSCEPAHEDGAGNDHEDTCKPYGRVCAVDPDAPAPIRPAECRLPEELEDCSPGVGCATLGDGFGELECVSGSGFSVCLRRCMSGGRADTAQCALGFTRCYGAGAVQGHCYFNYCSNVSACAPADFACLERERDAYFKPCSMAGPSDSTCLQVISDDGSEAGLCFQGGTAPSGGECDVDGLRTDGAPYPKHCKAPVVDGSGNVTSPGELCMRVQPKDPTDPGAGDVGTCRPICNAYTGADRKPALGCAGGDVCLDVTTVPNVERTWMGACMTGCDLFGRDVCPDDALGNAQGCSPTYDFAGNGFCRALQDDAAGFGEACAQDEVDPRGVCKDRLTCLQPAGEPSGRCTGWCNRAECADPGAACAGCAGLACCQKACQPGRCGVPDGCGGTCGCAAGERCDDANACEACVTGCTATSCGQSDGCGGTCGCGAGEVCDLATNACCAPTCLAGSCGGDDGCGGTCGCAEGETCDAGACVTCVKTCAADACDVDDGCGGTCRCAQGSLCDPATDTCTPCVRDCSRKACGPDGCGGTCGDCGANGACVASGGDQRCRELSFDETTGAWETTPVQVCDDRCAAKDEACTRDADCCAGTTCGITPPEKAGKCQ